MGAQLLKTTIGDLLDRQAERFAENEALVHVEHGIRYTYAEFLGECNRVAKGMMALGIEKGDHIGIWATNYAEWVVAQSSPQPKSERSSSRSIRRIARTS